MSVSTCFFTCDQPLRDAGDGADGARGAPDGPDDGGRAEPAHDDDDDTDRASDPDADSGDEATSEAEEEPSEEESVGGEADAHGDPCVGNEESKGEGMESGSGEDSDTTLPLPGGGPTDRPCLSPYPFDDSDAYSPTMEPGSPWEDDSAIDKSFVNEKPAPADTSDSDDEGPPNVPSSWRGLAPDVPPLPESSDESERNYITPAKRVATGVHVHQSSMKVLKKAKVEHKDLADKDRNTDAQHKGYCGFQVQISLQKYHYLYIYIYLYLLIKSNQYIYIFK